MFGKKRKQPADMTQKIPEEVEQYLITKNQFPDATIAELWRDGIRVPGVGMITQAKAEELVNGGLQLREMGYTFEDGELRPLGSLSGPEKE